MSVWIRRQRWFFGFSFLVSHLWIAGRPSLVLPSIVLVEDAFLKALSLLWRHVSFNHAG